MNTAVSQDEDADDGPVVGLVDLLTWIGQGKRTIAIVTIAATLIALVISMLLSPVFTARTSMLPPNNQQGGSGAAAMAALSQVSGLAGLGGLTPKTPDELYVALLKSDSLLRALDERFKLRERYEVKNFEALRKAVPKYVKATSDKKSGVISVEVDDEDPRFAADLANAHVTELTKLLSRLAVSEAQQRRAFFEQQLKDTKEHLVAAEVSLQQVQEKSGVIVLDKQAEALLLGAAQIRAAIAEREVQLKVLRTAATPQNPDVQRLNSELAALRGELSRLESREGGNPGSAVDMPVGRLPQVGIQYVRARRELKIQETLLEAMLRQYEVAKLDEAKEGPALQQIDKALPPDYKSKPSRALIVLGAFFGALLLSSAWVVTRRYLALSRELDPSRASAWQSLASAWRWRGA